MADKPNEPNEEQEEGAPAWMTTYSDLVTLLLTFFILLFSMASIDAEKFKAVSQSLQSTFLNVDPGGRNIIEQPPGDGHIEILNPGNISEGGSSDDDIEIDDRFEDLKEFFESSLEELELTEFVSVHDQEEFITLRLSSIVLFDLGSANLKDSGKHVLATLGTLLEELDNEIIIQGHTDDLPIDTLLFPSNWELSTRRATNTVVFILENSQIPPQNLTAAGNGEFRPVAPNDTPENRQKNRRIDIVVRKKEISSQQ